MADAPKRSFLKTRLGKVTVLGTVALIVTLVMFELACQVYFFVKVKPDFVVLTTDARCYWQRSENPILGFEMKRDITIVTTDPETKKERRLHVNKNGIRDDADEAWADKRRIAILGDSVVFGSGISQDETVPAAMQRLLDPEIKTTKVINYGEGGYSLEQMPELLRQRQAIFKSPVVIYLMNPNDFNLRDTIYEGADSGLYKAFHTPMIKSPWFIRKAIYRLVKGGGGDHLQPDVGWYTWMYEGCKTAIFPRFDEMAAEAKKGGYAFSVVLYPMRAAFDDKNAPMDPAKHKLAKEYDEIKAYLTKSGVPFVDVLPEATDITPDQWMDKTDHFTPQGADRMAQILKRAVLDKLAPAEPGKN